MASNLSPNGTPWPPCFFFEKMNLDNFPARIVLFSLQNMGSIPLQKMGSRTKKKNWRQLRSVEIRTNYVGTLPDVSRDRIIRNWAQPAHTFLARTSRTPTQQKKGKRKKNKQNDFCFLGMGWGGVGACIFWYCRASKTRKIDMVHGASSQTMARSVTKRMVGSSNHHTPPLYRPYVSLMK